MLTSNVSQLHMDVLEAHGECKVVVLVAHGLNLRAHALRDLYEPLRQRGAAIVVLRLRGHASDSVGDGPMLEEWKSIGATAWVEDWRESARVAEELATSRGVPLAFLGYSLGALIHVYGLATGERESNPFQRQVLLAPAVRVRPRTRLVLLFRPLGRRFIVPSLTPAEIRSHGGTSIAAYESLFGYEAALSALDDPKRVKIPTLVLMAPGDELVSQRRLVEWIERNGLRPEWRMRALSKDSATAQSWVRHHIITERGLGTAAFAALTQVIADALIDGVMDASADAHAI